MENVYLHSSVETVTTLLSRLDCYERMRMNQSPKYPSVKVYEISIMTVSNRTMNQSCLSWLKCRKYSRSSPLKFLKHHFKPEWLSRLHSSWHGILFSFRHPFVLHFISSQRFLTHLFTNHNNIAADDAAKDEKKDKKNSSNEEKKDDWFIIRMEKHNNQWIQCHRLDSSRHCTTLCRVM